VNYLRQWVFRCGLDYDVDVVRHDYPRKQLVALPVESQERFFDDSGDIAIRKVAVALP